jgi:SAM-dependent methyltransferase
MSPAPTEYMLGPGTTERARLVAQAALFDDEARWLLDRLDLTPGGHAIDVACGPIGILPLLAERVGPTGEVVGLDRSPEMLRHAADLVRERSLTNVRLVAGDATATGLERDAFDLAHVRLLLVNVPNPPEVLSEVVALVRPGGTVAVQEVDWMSWQCHPNHPAWGRLRDLLTILWRSQALDPCIGRRLPSLLRDAGLHDVRAAAHAGIDGPTEPYQRLLLTFVGHFAERIVAEGIATQGEIDALSAELAEHLAEPATIVVRALTVQAWGRREVAAP